MEGPWRFRPQSRCDVHVQLAGQDVTALPDLVRLGVTLVREHVDLDTVDHVLCHYSANTFRDQIFAALPELSGPGAPTLAERITSATIG